LSHSIRRIRADPACSTVWTSRHPKKTKASDGVVLSTILGIGVIAAYAYATGKCIQDIGDGVNQSAACDTVSSGW